jgi:hypothetical protein
MNTTSNGSGETATWLDYGPAEFDARLMPKKARPASADQSALFFIAVPPARKPAAPASQMAGQGSLFGDGEL